LTLRGTEGNFPSVPLRLDLLRHGEAPPATEGGDSARPLSETGRDTIARVGDVFARRGWRPDRVYASPLKRARETAAILIARACPGIEPEILDELTPERDPEEVTAALIARRAEGHVVLVAHQPLLGRLAAHLAGGDRGLAPGGLVSIEIEGAPGRRSGAVTLELRSP
jgi:phosphohistidine phosphatase